jgi:signal transduction histidine kinase
VASSAIPSAKPVPARKPRRSAASAGEAKTWRTSPGRQPPATTGSGPPVALLRVRDGCGGIAETDLPRVFDRLWRGDPARSSRGAGLGLAIARGFVEAHGGTITVGNVPGGCEFIVELPGPCVARPL